MAASSFSLRWPPAELCEPHNPLGHLGAMPRSKRPSAALLLSFLLSHLWHVEALPAHMITGATGDWEYASHSLVHHHS